MLKDSTTTVPMDSAEMTEVIKAAKFGEKITITFADKTFGGDLRGRLYMLLGMHNDSICFDELAFFTLQAVAQSGKWEGFRTYTITLLQEFDADYFISRTIGRELLESVTKL